MLSSDLRCQRLSDEWKPGHGFVRTRKDFVRTRKGFVRIPKGQIYSKLAMC